MSRLALGRTAVAVAIAIAVVIGSPAVGHADALGGAVAATLRAPSTTSADVRPQAPPQTTVTTTAGAGVTRTPTTAAPRPTSHRPGRKQVGAIAGALFLCLALLAWASGYGLLGGRVVPLSQPLPRP